MLALFFNTKQKSKRTCVRILPETYDGGLKIIAHEQDRVTEHLFDDYSKEFLIAPAL